MVRIRERRLLGRVLLLFGGGALVPLVLITLLGWRRERASNYRSGIDLLNARADETASAVRGMMDGYRLVALRFATAPDVVAFAAAEPDERELRLAEIQARVEKYAAAESAIRGLGLLDTDGTVLAASEAPLRWRSYADRGYFQKAAAGEVVVADPYVAEPEAAAEPSIAFANPVRAGGKVVAVAVLWVRAQRLWQLLESTNGKAGPGSYSALLDSLGIRIGHSANKNVVFRPTRPLPPPVIEQLIRERRFGSATRELASAPLELEEMYVAAHFAEREGFRRWSLPTQQWVRGVVRRIPELGWTLGYYVPEASLEVHLQKVLRETALAAALALMLTLVAAVILLRRVVRPIRALAEAAEAMRGGDFSARVQLGEPGELGQLAASFNSMADSVHRHTAELRDNSRELASARDAAMEASRLKSALLANVSHELRTPLNGVIGMLELLAGTELTPEQRSYAQTARTSGHSLLGIISDLLDISKIEAGKLELEVADFDLRRTLDELLEAFAERASSKGLELGALVRSDVPALVSGDSGRLLQILNNLVGNALKFTDRGEVLIEVSVQERSAEEARLRFGVADTGIGVPVELQRRLFQPFSQGDSSSTRRYGGTGLGLAISRQLAGKMGGEIGVESAAGQRTTFWFTARFGLPAQQAAQPQRELLGLRVLIAGDNETSRAILHHHVSGWGLRDDQVASGAAALEKVLEAQERGDPFQLVILESVSPGMDGLEAVRRIRALDAAVRPGIAVLTSFGDPLQGERAAEAGAEAFLTKPIRQSQLYEALLQAHSRNPQLHAIATPRTEAPAKRPSRHKRILVAEDNLVNQRVAQGILENLGYAVDLAATGVEALEALRAWRYDAVLMDCQMPELDGYEATRRLREREGGGRRTPVIAMTANALIGEREKCLEAGMDDYLSKPVSVEELEAALLRAVGAPAPEADVLDERVLQGLRDLQPGGGLVLELADLLARDGPLTIAAMRLLAEAGDAGGLGRTAHALKGSASNLGARGLARLCEQVEVRARSGELSAAAALFPAIASELERVLLALRQDQSAAPAA